MSITDWIAIGSFMVGGLAAMIALVSYFSNQEQERIRTIKKHAQDEINTQRDFNHLLRNYEGLSLQLVKLMDRVDALDDYHRETRNILINEIAENRGIIRKQLERDNDKKTTG